MTSLDVLLAQGPANGTVECPHCLAEHLYGSDAHDEIKESDRCSECRKVEE